MGEVKAGDRRFIYRTKIRWSEARKGRLSSPGKPTIEVTTPPEFKGHPGIWTPEELFVASVNTCIMTTFLYYADREGLKFLGYESSAEGILERTGGGFKISTIEVIPEILVKSSDDIEKAKSLLELSERNCFISNSIKSKIKVVPQIRSNEDAIYGMK